MFPSSVSSKSPKSLFPSSTSADKKKSDPIPVFGPSSSPIFPNKPVESHPKVEKPLFSNSNDALVQAFQKEL